ncbi:hypothetical protein AWZ03_009359 [Drosophila navojoa]|uniref:Uncharacterized protein n=1 Tax=Drosophila navojoa TaxID=7232 RepID=A0A484B6G4_DRONA|nr:hypothetical protein AWZ03_009359 [Drosophila navojoa]
MKSIETLRVETPEEFYALKEAQKLNGPDDSQLNAAHGTTVTTTRQGGSGGGGGVGGVSAVIGIEHKLQLRRLKFKREIHALALEGGDVARGYCSCDEQWTNLPSPASTTTSATMSPTLTAGSANAKASGGGNANVNDNGNGNGSGNGNGNGIVKMATLKKRGSGANAAGVRLKQQHHVRFSDEKNFSD